MSTELATIEHSQTALEIRSQVNRIQQVMKEVMQDGQHFGVIPGCGNKPTLLKPGAEKLMMTFRLAVDPEVEDLSDSQVRRYRVRTRVTSQVTGVFLGTGIGECSSDEEKYAWREAVCQEEYEATDPALRREKWKKNQKEPLYQVHTNPSDVANTILKMAKKRSLIDAILTVTGASDIFTQDLEDMPEELRDGQPAPRKAKPAPSNEPCVPNYGPDAGKPFSQVSTDHLKDYLQGMERSIADPKKERFKQSNEKMRDALAAEIAKREPEPMESTAPATPPAAPVPVGVEAQASAPAPLIASQMSPQEMRDQQAQQPYKMKIGRQKGQPVTDLDGENLEWALNYYLDKIRDQPNSRFVSEWEDAVLALQEEKTMREGVTGEQQ